MVYKIISTPRHIPEMRAEIQEHVPLGHYDTGIYFVIVRLTKGYRKEIFRRIKFDFPAEQEILKKRHRNPPKAAEFAYEYPLDKTLLVYVSAIRNSILYVKEISAAELPQIKCYRSGR